MKDIDLEFELDEPPQKVWRAISIPEFREYWLPNDVLADPEATTLKSNEEVSYRMRESEPPFLESTVTFQITPNENGGTHLRVIHELTDAKLNRITKATANNNTPSLMLAA